jgi:hypothetical protein
MKYAVDVMIAAPMDRVIAAYVNHDNYPYWQRGLLNVEPLSGTPGEVGAKTQLKFKMGKGEMEMIETITANNPPALYALTYETGGVFNEIRTRFAETAPGQTHLVSENEFRFSGLMMKLMGWIMPGAFRKQTRQYMVDFKAFVETGKSVRES